LITETQTRGFRTPSSFFSAGGGADVVGAEVAEVEEVVVVEVVVDVEDPVSPSKYAI
jgi:hypothetical protein